MCVSKAEPIYLRRRDIAIEGTETYRVLSYFADEDVANKCRMDIFYVTAKEVPARLAKDISFGNGLL